MSYDDDMCPNCCTPWKCNGPHTFDPTELASTDALDRLVNGNF